MRRIKIALLRFIYLIIHTVTGQLTKQETDFMQSSSGLSRSLLLTNMCVCDHSFIDLLNVSSNVFDSLFAAGEGTEGYTEKNWIV